RRQLRIRAKLDCASHRTTVSTSKAQRGNSKIISAMWLFSGANGACQKGRTIERVVQGQSRAPHGNGNGPFHFIASGSLSEVADLKEPTGDPGSTNYFDEQRLACRILP